MAEYALLIEGRFQEIKRYDARPPDLPHKNTTWHNVVREFGKPYEGLEGNDWVIRTVDPASFPPSVPESITRRQCALELNAQGVISLSEALAMTKAADVPAAISQIFSQMSESQRILAEIDFAATNYYRSNPLLSMMGLSEEDIDKFFISASTR